ncbi:uncharacterized protein RSE6_00914 [Rhynchosporium secalis]|uniref:Uncharacterized protein n=1 Tax=Rhynchosporium secalis TaxID=38038 RepID=A0A1E1LWF4_RHYSE|nr:uncharacterized protein RSE6_00914 [Rhynchosporium secalis]
MIRRDKIVSKSVFRTRFLDIEIETRDVQRQYKPDNETPKSVLSKFEPTISQRFTKYNVKIKIPFWQGGITYHSGNSGMVYGGSLCKAFRTYNTVPHDAPILKACRRLDLAEVRRLFREGLASPTDCDTWARPLFQIVAYKLLFVPNPNARQVDTSEILRSMIFHASFSGKSFDRALEDVLADSSRMLIMQSSEDAFNGSSQYLSISLSESYLYPVLFWQQQWFFDNTVTIDNPEYENYFFEKDLGILTDPDGTKPQSELAAKRDYAPVNERVHSCSSVVKFRGQIHILLYFASERREKIFHDYLSELWMSALDKAGLTQFEIQDIIDEDLFAGLPEFLDCELEYKTRCEQRKQFIEELQRGKFTELSDGDLLDWIDGEARNLFPGRDFRLFGGGKFYDQHMRDWERVRRCEENEIEKIERIEREVAKAKTRKEFESAEALVCNEDQVADEFYNNVTSHENTKHTSNIGFFINIEADHTLELASDDHSPHLCHDQCLGT